MNVLVYSVRVRGTAKWRLDYVESGKRRRPTFASRTAADARAAELRRGVATARGWWSSLPANDRDRIVAACHDAHTRGHVIEELFSRSTQLAPLAGPTLGEVISEMLLAKENAGRSSRYTDSLKWILNQFAKGQESRKIEALALSDVERFLDGRKVASRSTLRARLSTLFKFAVRRGYRSDNPCARLEPITVTRIAPEVFSVKQFKSAVGWMLSNASHGLAWFALSSLCGLRPEEAEKTTKADVNFKEGFIRVEAQTTKVRQRRVVYPRPEAMAFLKWVLKRGGEMPLPQQRRRRMIRGLRDALGFKAWPKDITRHTAASYWLAADGSAAHVAEMLGNSESVLKRHYKALVTKAEAKEFWAMVQRLANTRK